MSNRLNRRFSRVSITLGLLLFQVNLLWVAALHRHEIFEISTSHPSAIRQASQPQQPSADSGLLCIACQIVRHAAAWPSTGATASEAQGAVFFLATSSHSAFQSRQPSAHYGRAPPRA
ncbi:MAG TPA: hypothetical protein VG204_07455 [Terriglobia bacterium]|nr:hypothetical protein [Terriglobia bacterium]